MTRQELLDLHKATCQAGYDIMEAKNIDYCGGDAADPFANFRATEMLGIPAELGILTRCLDKFQRIRSFVNNGTLAVKSESVDDAIEDVINYMVLLKGVIKERQKEGVSISEEHIKEFEKEHGVEADDSITLSEEAACMFEELRQKHKAELENVAMRYEGVYPKQVCMCQREGCTTCSPEETQP